MSNGLTGATDRGMRGTVQSHNQPNFGALLKHYRRLADLTQAELAAAVGLSAATIGAYETGQRRPPKSDGLQWLLKALKLSEDERRLLQEAANRDRRNVADRYFNGTEKDGSSLPIVLLNNAISDELTQAQALSDDTIAPISVQNDEALSSYYVDATGVNSPKPNDQPNFESSNDVHGLTTVDYPSVPLPSGLNPKAEDARIRFTQLYQHVLQKAEALPLSIFLWNPLTPLTDEVATKRKQIQRSLEGMGNFVVAPLGSIEYQKTFGDLRGTVEANAADLTFILIDDQLTSLNQAVPLCANHSLSAKMYVMIPKKFKDQAHDTLRLLIERFDGVYWYEDQDITDCHVLTHAVQRCMAHRLRLTLMEDVQQ